MNAKKDQTFEKAIVRLEEILEKMNSGTVALEESMHLYEEADSLISYCGKQLNQAEKKIETLIKKRDGELKLGSDGNPETADFDLDE
jgi:exodeoxyribonuclease VII small subunit